MQKAVSRPGAHLPDFHLGLNGVNQGIKLIDRLLIQAALGIGLRS